MERLTTPELEYSRGQAIHTIKNTNSTTAKEALEYQLSVLDTMIATRKQLVINFDLALQNTYGTHDRNNV